MTKKQIKIFACIFTLGCVIMVAAFVAQKFRSKVEWDGNIYNIEEVNPVDAKFAQPYNEFFDKFGDAFVYLLFVEAFVLIVFSAKSVKKSFFDLYTLCVCVFYGNGFYRILKTIAGRIRPYMYFANPSETGITEGDFYRSWPSGHSASVFTIFGFLLAFFAFRKTDSKLKKPVLSVTLLLCFTTMYLRMLSGNHFLTDVLSGAVIGFAISYSMAVLCNSIYKKN